MKKMGLLHKDGTAKRSLAILIAALMFGVIIFGASRGLKSELFLVKVVEVGELSIDGAINPELLIQRAQIPVGKIQIFDLDLAAIEHRLQGNPWIKRIRIERRLPHTVAICPELRTPVALLQDEKGALHYLDADLISFGPVRPGVATDLPLLSSSIAEHQKQERALSIMSTWHRFRMEEVARLEELHYREDSGFSLLVMYKTAAPKDGNERIKTWVELGEEYDQDGAKVFLRLKKTLTYVSRESMNIRSILTDIGKKIVVKFARGS